MSLSGRVEGTSAAVLVPHVAAAATTNGLKVAAPVPGTLMLTRSFRPGWSVLVGICLIVFALVAGSLDAGPIVWLFVVVGVLLIIFVKQSETVSLVVTDGGGGVDVTATGTAGDDLRDFVAGVLPDVAGEAIAPASSPTTAPRWALVALGAAIVVVAVGAVVVWLGQDDDTWTSSEALAINASVSSKVGTNVTCDRLGFGSKGAVYRCKGGGSDNCWLLVDNSNISGGGVRLARPAEFAKFHEACG